MTGEQTSAQQDEREAEAWLMELCSAWDFGIPGGAFGDIVRRIAGTSQVQADARVRIPAGYVLQPIEEARASKQVQADAGAVAEADDLLRACHRWHAGDGHTKKRIENVREALAAYTRPAAESGKRDAERYRWLRLSGYAEIYLHDQPNVDSCKDICGGALDDVIDAAMSREQSGGDRG